MQNEGGVNVKTIRFNKLWMTVLGLLLVGLLTLITPMSVYAEPSQSLEICGDGVTNPQTFTLSQLQAMKPYQHVYSTINTWPTKKWYVGEGVKLRELLNLAGIKEDAQLITFTSNDGYMVTLTVKELLRDKRYYFPNLKDNHASDGSTSGSPTGAVEVEPILALVSTEGNTNPDIMNDMDSIMLMCGQRAVTEQTNNIFLKYIDKIEVLTATPEKWDNPRASISSGEISAGTLIELSNKSNDADKIYYTTDGSTPTINSPVFNWSAKRWWNQRPDNLKNINKPIEINKDTIIKAKTIGPGKEDSDVVTFSYKIGNSTSGQGLPAGPPTGVTLDQDQVNLKVGGTYLLEAFVGPDNASDKRVTWSSSDTRVATVDNHGLVTVIGPGIATITAKTVVGNFTASCTIKVDSESTGGQISKPVALNLKEDQEQESKVEIEPQLPETNQKNPVEEVTNADLTTANEAPAVEPPAEPEVLEANQRYLASREVANVDSTITDVSSQQPDNGLDGHILEVSMDTVPIPIKQNSLDIYTAIIFLILFLSGAGKRYMKYTKEVKR